MTVAELIKQLKTCNPKAQVYIHFATKGDDADLCDTAHSESYTCELVKSWGVNDLVVGLENIDCIRC